MQAATQPAAQIKKLKANMIFLTASSDESFCFISRSVVRNIFGLVADF